MKAAIDVGSNTVRMILGETAAGRVYPHLYLRRITRLGGGYQPLTGIAPESAERTLAALEEFAAVIAREKPERVRAVGTEAIRRSCNAAEFVAAVHRRTGIELEIIDGATEAGFSSRGVLSALAPLPDACLIFDIGGGSTEFILLRGTDCLFRKSYPLGVVALAESHDPQRTIRDCIHRLVSDLEQVGVAAVARSPECEVVGTAGSVTTLAAIDLAMSEYDWQRVNNYVLSRQRIVAMHQEMVPLTPAARERVPGMEPGRGDLIVYGMEIVLELLAVLDKPTLKISDFGLLEGVLLS